MIYRLLSEFALDTRELVSLGLDYTYWQARASGFSERDFHAGFILTTFVGFGFLLMAAYPETRHPVLASMVLTLPPGQYDWRRIVKVTFLLALGIGCILLLATAPPILSQDGMTLKEIVGDHETRIRATERMLADHQAVFWWIKTSLSVMMAAVVTAVGSDIYKTFIAGRKARAKEE